jgi:long-subunit fatty acid transport protein
VLGRRRKRRIGALAHASWSLALLAHASSAAAGGFELPDNGTQSLGRGTAFVAKADDPTAIQYNPAGLARQRGTSLLLNGNLSFHSYEFRRSGAFPDDPNDPETPWGGRPYPVVQNQGTPFFAPFVAVTSDFAYFDRLTVGLGVYGPSAIGNRTFPLGVDNAPAASRYDFVQSRSTLIYPTASAGFRVTPWLDVGISGHLVLARFDQTTVSSNDFGRKTSDGKPGPCPNDEYFPCDSRSTLVASATSVAATLGAMARPLPNVSFGASVRTPININGQGSVTPQPPKKVQVDLQPGAATIALQLPWVVRVGGRYVALDGDFEVYDLELDVVYEGWGTAQRIGPIVRVPSLGAFKDIETVVQHGYKDTFSIRGGGAYNIDMGSGVLSLRAGGYFETPATDFPYTRLDFDTLAKVAGTLGAGFRVGAVRIDGAYAAIASIPRVVGAGQGAIRPINGLKQGQTVNADNEPYPPVNEGAYRGFTHLLSIGVTITFDSFFGPQRPIRYGNPYEPGYVGDDAVKPDTKKTEKPETKPDEKKDEPRPAEKPSDKPSDKPEEKKPEPSEPPDAGKKKPDPNKTPNKKKEWWEELDSPQ